jgi:hypothetical protein
VSQVQFAGIHTFGSCCLVLVALRLPEARDLLAALAKGDEKEWLTQEAKKALDRASK